MNPTLRGRSATRVVVFAAILSILTVSALLATVSVDVRPAGARPAETPTPGEPSVGGSGGGSTLLRLPETLAAVPEVAAQVAEAVSVTAVPPPPPPPPVYCPAPGAEFVDSWGFARSGGRRHKGVDMMAPHGTPVLAPVDGVIRASNSSLGGIGYYLEDATGNVYFGTHLASLDVAEGPVVAGQQIGTVGSTGNASSPHLHFEVEQAGVGSVNPFPFAFDWCTTDFSQPGVAPLLP